MLPALLFGFIISTLIGVLFHVWRGGGLLRLIFYIFLAWTGFWMGHFIAEYLNFSFFKVGQLNLGLALVFSLIFLGIGYWLSLIPQHK
jgi:hypothetical protein